MNSCEELWLMDWCFQVMKVISQLKSVKGNVVICEKVLSINGKGWRNKIMLFPHIFNPIALSCLHPSSFSPSLSFPSLLKPLSIRLAHGPDEQWAPLFNLQFDFVVWNQILNCFERFQFYFFFLIEVENVKKIVNFGLV